MSAKTLVIGAGVSGLSAALALLQRGRRVTVLERGEVGGESSWAGGGILSPLLPWDYPEAVTALALRSMGAFGGWVAQIEATSGRNAEFWRCGMLALVDAPDTGLEWCAAHGMVATRSSPDALTLAPAVRSRPAVWLPEVAQVRNPRLVAALHATVVKLGGVIHEDCPASAVVAERRRVTAVEAAGKSFPADSVVLAAGAWSGLALGRLAPVPHVRPIRGQMLLFKLEPGTLGTVLFRKGLYLIPRLDGHVLVGSTIEDAGFDKATDDATRRRLHAEASELLPALAGLQPLRHWAGLRPGAPDNIPVIDRHPDYENVFVNAGHFRYGVTMAPASAELLVALMDGTVPALDPAPYRWLAALQRRWPQGQ